jgi:hypothetical protein
MGAGVGTTGRVVSFALTDGGRTEGFCGGGAGFRAVGGLGSVSSSIGAGLGATRGAGSGLSATAGTGGAATGAGLGAAEGAPDRPPPGGASTKLTV